MKSAKLWNRGKPGCCFLLDVGCVRKESGAWQRHFVTPFGAHLTFRKGGGGKNFLIFPFHTLKGKKFPRVGL